MVENLVQELDEELGTRILDTEDTVDLIVGSDDLSDRHLGEVNDRLIRAEEKIVGDITLDAIADLDFVPERLGGVELSEREVEHFGTPTFSLLMDLL